MHGQAFEHFEEEESGEGQDDEQQRVFDRPFAFQVLVHRVDEAHAEAAAGQRLTTAAGHAAVQGFLQVGGEKRGLPMGGKSLISDLALGRQVVTDEAWMRPVGIQRNFAGLAHRQDL
ncbi:hypothetical protein D3C87_1711100 [compost metagenome]